MGVIGRSAVSAAPRLTIAAGRSPRSSASPLRSCQFRFAQTFPSFRHGGVRNGPGRGKAPGGGGNNYRRQCGLAGPLALPTRRVGVGGANTCGGAAILH